MFNEIKIRSMKRIFLMFALVVSVFTANAQEVQEVTEETATVIETKPTTGDYYQGFTRPLTFDRMIPPYAGKSSPSCPLSSNSN